MRDVEREQKKALEAALAEANKAREEVQGRLDSLFLHGPMTTMRERVAEAESTIKRLEGEKAALLLAIELAKNGCGGRDYWASAILAKALNDFAPSPAPAEEKI